MVATADVITSQHVEIPDAEIAATHQQLRQRGGWRDMTSDEDRAIITT